MMPLFRLIAFFLMDFIVLHMDLSHASKQVLISGHPFLSPANATINVGRV